MLVVKLPAMALLSTRTRARAKTRRFTAIELAIAFALAGSLLAVAVPTFVREVHASRFVEPVEGLQRIGAAAVAYGRLHPIAQGFPASAPETPALPPRGRCEADPPDLWEQQPTWAALDFRPAPPGTPHCYAFTFDSTLSPSKSLFRADAHGDLDGDGIVSTFEMTGRYVEGDPNGPVLDKGVFVESEVE
jgi:type II secretory pathway pseudopilin PulG